MDKISVIIPCYNAEMYIEKCIESLKSQEYKNFEVFLIDDGSQDKTKEIIKKLIINDERFQYQYKKNGGVSSARNLGIKKATGKYICFLDSDDWVDADYLSSLYNSIKDEKSDLAVCNIKRVYNNKITYNKIDKKIDLLKYTAPWNKIYKRSMFEENSILFPEGIWYEDIAVSYKTYILSDKISINGNYPHNYIQNENSLVRACDDRIFDIYKIVDELERFSKEKNLYDKFKSDLEFLCIYHVLIGTVYRASFHKEFSVKMIKDITGYVNERYPNWNKNPYLKTLSPIFRIYLIFIQKNKFKFIFSILKRWNKKFRL